MCPSLGDHIVQEDKGRCIAKIVNNCHTLAMANPEIDEERARRRLLCRNCHNTRKQWDSGTVARRQGEREGGGGGG